MIRYELLNADDARRITAKARIITEEHQSKMLEIIHNKIIEAATAGFDYISLPNCFFVCVTNSITDEYLEENIFPILKSYGYTCRFERHNWISDTITISWATVQE